LVFEQVIFLGVAFVAFKYYNIVMSKKIENLAKKANPVFRKYKVKKASIFGSFARGEEKKNSDIDILIELGPLGGLMVMGKIKSELETVFKRKVDLITFRSVNHLLAPSIIKDELKIYGKR